MELVAVGRYSDVMATDFDFSELREAQLGARLAERALQYANRRRDRLIVQAHAAGASARAISMAVDVTEGRIYQIVRAGFDSTDGYVGGAPARFVRLVDSNGDDAGSLAVVLEEWGDEEFGDYAFELTEE